MKTSPPGILENKKDKVRALVLAIATALSIFFFFYGLEQHKQVESLKAELEECRSQSLTN